MALASLAALSGPKKVSIFRAQPPPTCPRNGSARIKNIVIAAYIAILLLGPLHVWSVVQNGIRKAVWGVKHHYSTFLGPLYGVRRYSNIVKY
jgi:hypothetical protein